MSLLAASTWQRSVPAMLAAVLLSGCTMCPDPFDYSGPVPNGSPPHNDFRARSNGILPLNAAPVPWPPLVKSEAKPGVHRAGGQKPEADTENPAVTPAGFTEGEAAESSAKAAGASPTDVTPPLADDSDSAMPEAPTDEPWNDLEPTGAEVEPESPAEAAVEAAPAVPLPAAPFAETPGWRARR